MLKNDAKLNIIWAEFIIWDLSLSKTTELEILNGLARLGHNVELIALRSKQVSMRTALFRSTLVPLRNIRLLVPVMFTIVEAFLLSLRVAFSKIDFIITEPGLNVLGFFPAILLGKLRKTKFVLDIRSPPVESSSRFLWTLEKLSCDISVLLAMRFFRGITIITSQMRTEFSQRYNLDEDRIGVWSSGVSPIVFNPLEYPVEKRSILKQELGISERFVVLYHGFFAEDRGLKESVQAMALLEQGCPNVVLFLLGSGPYEQELKKIIAEQNLSKCVKLHESVKYSDVPKFIAMCDVGLVPLPDLSKWKSQCPLKLLEYLAMEKPVILTDLPAHREIVQQNEIGMFVGEGTPESISRGIRFAYKNRANLAEWGKKGQEIVAEKYTWDKVAKTLEAYLIPLSRD